jgi:P27 family predicted phage terminase small subunit
MGLRGPPAKPTHLKLLRGNPGHQVLNKREPRPALPDKPPPPPDTLSGYAREEWDRIVVEAFRLKLVTALDINPLAAYCDAYERWRTARETIAGMAQRDEIMHGLIVKTQSGGAAPNPLVLIAQSAARDMVRFASEFGLTPAARSRISAGEAIGEGKFTGFIAS